MSTDLLAESTHHNAYAARARHIITEHQSRPDHVTMLKSLPKLKDETMIEVLNLTPISEKNPVCIIGAGAAGLYTAMILEDLKIPYKLLEASDHVGGRLFTYKGFKNAEEYDYYDVGAMRFPDTPFMKRTFDLARNRGLANVKLIPYEFRAKNTFLFYNNQRAIVEDPYGPPPANTFGAEDYLGPENEHYLKEGVHSILSNLLSPLLDPFKTESIDEAIQKLMKYDQYSMRDYMSMASNPNFPSQVINWCETMDKSTGWYDRALTETVLESVAFAWPGVDPKSIKWYCFDKGSSTLPQAMNNKLSTRATCNTTVTALANKGDLMDVTSTTFANGVSTTTTVPYAAVISTMPLPRLSVVDLTGCKLSYGQWNAIRALRYGPSIKIGIRFSHAWWETLPSGPIVGGQSYTDSPLRTIVYPSYPEGPDKKSRVLIASYCWTQDAERLGGMIHGDGTCSEELLNLVFRDLGAVHGLPENVIRKYYTTGDYFAWDWLHDPLTMGAFAFFGPQEFSDSYYTDITKSACGDKLYFAGEATSSCHAWVAGALDSAWRAVFELLSVRQGQLPGRLETFLNNWGKSEYWDKGQLENHVRLNIAHRTDAPL